MNKFDANYQGKPEQKKRRALRNNARRRLEREGKVHKGDGMDVDHRRPLCKNGSNSTKNLRVVPKSKNRSFSRNSKGGMK